MPRTFSTVRELIYWEYAKLISEKAVGDRMNYKFTNFTFRRFVEGKAAPSSILTENQQLFALGDVCAYVTQNNVDRSGIISMVTRT